MQAHEEKAYKSVFLRFQVANSVVFDQVFKETLRCIFRKHGFTEAMWFSAALAKRVPLEFPSGKKFPFFFLGIKEWFKTCVSEIVKLLSNSLFFVSL